LTVVVDIDKLFEGLYDVDVIAEVDDDVFRTSVEDVVEQREGLTVGRSTFAATDKNQHIKRESISASQTAGSCPSLSVLTLKTCLQFLPLSFNLLSSISITSTNSFCEYVICAISFICDPDGPHGSFEVAPRILT
jgi:hypothetical protein